MVKVTTQKNLLSEPQISRHDPNGRSTNDLKCKLWAVDRSDKVHSSRSPKEIPNFCSEGSMVRVTTQNLLNEPQISRHDPDARTTNNLKCELWRVDSLSYVFLIFSPKKTPKFCLEGSMVRVVTQNLLSEPQISRHGPNGRTTNDLKCKLWGFSGCIKCIQSAHQRKFQNFAWKGQW